PLLVWALGPAQASSSSPRPPDARGVYAGLPVEVQLLVADIKLDGLIKEADAAGEAAKARTLGEAKAVLKEALRKYEFYRTGDKAVLAAEWGFSWIPPRPDFPSVTKSPLSLLEHLWIGYDMAVQMRAGIMVAPVQYSAAEAERNESLDGGVALMNKVIKAVESSGAWTVYWLSDARLMISLPADFKRATPMKTDLVRFIKSKPDGSVQALAFVTRAFLERDETEMSAEQYREQRIAKLRDRFPDMSGIERGEIAAGEAGDFAASFSYQYAWEGAPIKALVRIRRAGSVAHETNYVAPAASFDRDEADRILASLLFR
ncbi:MAG: hypothetical protein JW742_03935, partial [Candidatus Aminicenantes bacterium]|nr:hypothetical protein [Candidatus Aminicenantes bacterium]